jgi:hypothetical protein
MGVWPVVIVTDHLAFYDIADILTQSDFMENNKDGISRGKNDGSIIFEKYLFV